jgi:putative NADH-flavin reductase
MKVCIVGASGKLGQSMVQHTLDRGYEVVGVCREESVGSRATAKTSTHGSSRRS